MKLTELMKCGVSTHEGWYSLFNLVDSLILDGSIDFRTYTLVTNLAAK